MENMDEQALVAAAAEGDVDAFNDLVIEYQQLAFNVAYRILGDPERASDATQDAFLRGFRALYQFRGGSFKAWILRIVTNCSYDQLRARQRKPSTPIDDLVEDDEHSTLLEDDRESPEDWVGRSELAAVIQRGIAKLPPEQRTVIILSDIEGMSYEEIADVTVVSLGTVKSRLSRARAKMRDYLVDFRELLPNADRLFGDS